MSPGVDAAQWRNPLRDKDDKRLPRIADPCALVLFGVTGDLAHKKVVPAIYDLANRGLLPPTFSLVGFGRPCGIHAQRRRATASVAQAAGDGTNIDSGGNELGCRIVTKLVQRRFNAEPAHHPADEGEAEPSSLAVRRGLRRVAVEEHVVDVLLGNARTAVAHLDHEVAALNDAHAHAPLAEEVANGVESVVDEVAEDRQEDFGGNLRIEKLRVLRHHELDAAFRCDRGLRRQQRHEFCGGDA